MTQTQLNARINEETRKQLDSIVDYYRSSLTIGRVSKGDVIQDIIKKSFEQLVKSGKIKIQED